MEINDSIQIFKDSISRGILELTIVSKSWIVLSRNAAHIDEYLLHLIVFTFL